jgi:8-oxo-dGTP pyrophosphatase MutT (NUDIX family)
VPEPPAGLKPITLHPPFYRVSVKALVFDDQQRLLVVQVPEGTWEMPGGGWEEDEPDAEACLRREFEEELGRSDLTVGALRFAYRTPTPRGCYAVRLVYEVTLAKHNVSPGPGMVGAKFVTPEELQALDMAYDEAPIKQYADQIWQTAK